MNAQRYEIIQIDPNKELFGGCLAVVSEVNEWGVLAYVQSAGVPGQQYIRCKWSEFERTGGAAVWIV